MNKDLIASCLLLWLHKYPFSRALEFRAALKIFWHKGRQAVVQNFRKWPKDKSTGSKRPLFISNVFFYIFNYVKNQRCPHVFLCSMHVLMSFINFYIQRSPSMDFFGPMYYWRFLRCILALYIRFILLQ